MRIHSAGISVSMAIALVLSLVAACAPTPKLPYSEEMFIKASALTKLAAAVESTVRYKNPPPGLDEKELLVRATQHDPALLRNFKGHKVRVLRQDKHSVVLVCDSSGQRALLEDAGCSGRMDRHRWMGKPQPCEFSIDTKEVCRKN